MQRIGNALAEKLQNLCVDFKLLVVLRTAEELAVKPQLDPGTKLVMQCLTCPDGTANLDPASPTYQACNY